MGDAPRAPCVSSRVSFVAVLAEAIAVANPCGHVLLPARSDGVVRQFSFTSPTLGTVRVLALDGPECLSAECVQSLVVNDCQRAEPGSMTMYATAEAAHELPDVVRWC